jgi:hypothetical protein
MIHFIVLFYIPVPLYITSKLYELLSNDILSTILCVFTNGLHFTWHITVEQQQNSLKMMH